MTRFLPSARALPLFLVSAVLCSSARPCRAAADGEKDEVSKQQLIERVHPAFQNLQGQSPDEQMTRIIPRVDKNFTDKIRSQDKSKYSQAEVKFVEGAIPYSIEWAKKVKEVYAGPGDPVAKTAKVNEATAQYNAQINKLTEEEGQRQAETLRKDHRSEKEVAVKTAALKSFGTEMNLPMQNATSPAPPKQINQGAAAPTANSGALGSIEGKSNTPGTPAPDRKDDGTLGRLLFESVQGAFTRPEHPPKDHAGENASVPGMGEAIGLPTDNRSPASAMTHAGDQLLKGDVSGALASASKAVEMGGGADALTMRGGIELDQQNFSKANQDAKQALQLDPKNAEAAAIAHFSEGRADGVATGGPAGAKVAGAGPSPAAGGAAGGGSMGGGAGGGFASGGVGSESASPSAGGLSASAGGPSGGALSRMSGEQARTAAQGALAMGDYGGAMAFVNRAIAQNPGDPALLNLRSTIRGRQRDYAGSETDAKSGLALAPKDSALLRSLGFAQLREKDYQAAVATANQMLELNPNDPYAYALRGHAYGSLGDRDAMMSDLKRAAELDPSFREAAVRLEGQLQLPSDKDILFLFPGEESASGAKKAAPASGRARNFGLLVGASALGGLLLALGLLATVLAPLKERVTSAFTRLTRTGPTLGALAEDETPQPASVNGLMPGLIRGQYELSRQIGVGGMGMVFAGMDRALGRPVAVKRMRDELRHDAREKARFVVEAKTVAALHHPNIVDIYAIAEEGDDIFLVFEYVEGKTVHDLLQAGGKFSPERAAKIVRASADALEYAHARGVIHRDMKPSNVMLNQAGQVKVMDFGIARMAKDTLLRQSATNTVAGTPPYMAPEQEQGKVRSESDVYALAVCAYEMLTGKLPFVGSGGGMLLNKINMSFTPPSRQTAGLPAALDGVFERAFQADPDMRYRTPREFADALEAAAPASQPLRA